MKGKITLSRYSSNQENLTPIHIVVEDDQSGSRFLDLSMSLENFAFMLTGLGYIDCDFELNGKYVGKIKEHKTEEITVSFKWDITEEDKTEYLKPYEIDGWMGYSKDIGNSHKLVKGKKDTYTVGFTRYIDK